MAVFVSPVSNRKRGPSPFLLFVVSFSLSYDIGKLSKRGQYGSLYPYMRNYLFSFESHRSPVVVSSSRRFCFSLMKGSESVPAMCYKITAGTRGAGVYNWHSLIILYKQNLKMKSPAPPQGQGITTTKRNSKSLTNNTKACHCERAKDTRKKDRVSSDQASISESSGVGIRGVRWRHD
jgi:hypothetical protein